MTTKKKIALLHHADADGFGAAFAAWHGLTACEKADEPELLTIPVQYGQEPPYEQLGGFAPNQIYILDFSYKAGVLASLASEFPNITVLDHHRTTVEEFKDYRPCVALVLSNGALCWVDVEDQPLVAEYSWSEAAHGGAIAYVRGSAANGGKAKYVYMHRLIMGATDPSVLVDHRNRNTLDNRKSNLRSATRQQNAANMDRGSLFKGITPAREKWAAQIMVDGVRIGLGSAYETQEEAAAAYDAAAEKYFGEYARGNNLDYSPLPPTCVIHVDETRSGAVIAWQFFNPETPIPEILLYVQDRDLWKFDLEHSKEINAFIGTMEWSFDAWMDFYTPEAYDCGKAILAFQAGQIGRRVKAARLIRVVEDDGYAIQRTPGIVDFTAAGYDAHKTWMVSEDASIAPSDATQYLVPIVNASENISELGSALCEAYPDAPFSVSYCDREDGLRTYSLRSRNGFDVSVVAKAFGGGGHQQSAGFEMPAPPIFHDDANNQYLASLNPVECEPPQAV